jgi:trimethylamine:corrinoid methyltransferase-like protein
MKRLLTAAAWLLLAGCGNPPLADENGTGVRVTTAAAHNRAAPIPFTVQNGTSATLQIPACGGQMQVVAERMAGGAWSVVPGAPCGDGVSTAPVQLTPGAQAQGGKVIASAGQYRLRLVFTATESNGTSFQVLSNEFVVD